MSLRALLWKDARRELRSKEAFQAGAVLVALFLLLDLFAFQDLSSPGDEGTAAAVLWTPLLYATAALVGRGFASEADRGTLDLLRSAPVPLLWHGVSRTVLNLLLTGLLAAATLLLAAALFAVPLSWTLAVVLGLGVVGLTIVGTLVGALAAQARTRDVLLPMLLVPVSIPLVQAGVQGTTDILSGTGPGTPGGSILAPLLMLGYDLVAAGVCWILWPIVLEADG